MSSFFTDSFHRAREAFELVATDAAHVSVGWLVAGVVLHVLSQVVRIRGWFTILRASYPEAKELRARDVTSAYLAGAGLNSLLPARAGDFVKFAFLHRRIPGSSYPTLVATSLPETTFESLCGAALVAWMLTRGFLPVPEVPGELPSADVSLYLNHPILTTLVTVGVLAVAAALLRWLKRRSSGLTARLRRGLAIFSSPKRFLFHVVSWQALGRVVRLASLACFLAAFSLPATVVTALLVMAAQGGGRIIPLAPVSAGLRIAMLSYGLVGLTGQAVDPAAVTVFTFGVSATLFVVMLAISVVLVAREFGTWSPRCALDRARKRLTPPLPVPPPLPLPPAGAPSQASSPQ